MSSEQLVWLITGTSSGIGRHLTLAALQRGDKVIATGRSRSFAKLADLQAQGADVLELDVTAPLESLQEVAKKAVQIHGRIDVLVNNAGYTESGSLEAQTPEETLSQFNTNVFGPLNVNRAFLPYMRERHSGTVVWIGSLSGWRSAPTMGLYSATKHAIRALSQTLHTEISPLGLRSICIEPGAFKTDLLTSDNRASHGVRIGDYKLLTEAVEAHLVGLNHNQAGDTNKGVEIIIDVVKGEGCAAGKPFPLILPLGSDVHGVIKEVCENTTEHIETWKDVICSTDVPA